jgi:hypothetical protein
MKYLGALVNAANKKISAKKKCKNVQSLEHLIAGSGSGSTPGPLVDLEGEEPPEELVQESAKRQRVRVPSEDPITPIKAVPVHSEKGDFLLLPKVWSEPELCGPQSTLFLDDPELKIIQDLGPAGQIKAITDGVIATIKALEVAVAMNNASLESEVRADALARERDALSARVAALVEDQRSKGPSPRSVTVNLLLCRSSCQRFRLLLSKRLRLLGSWLRRRRPWRKL